jgi:putative FmdB family regulatory protein
MPIYEYACSPCGKVFEELILRPADEDDLACPACKSAEVTRRMSRPASARTGGPAGGGGLPPGCGPIG